MSDTQLHELCKGFGALLSRSKVSDRDRQIILLVYPETFSYVSPYGWELCSHACHLAVFYTQRQMEL